MDGLVFAQQQDWALHLAPVWMGQPVAWLAEPVLGNGSLSAHLIHELVVVLRRQEGELWHVLRHHVLHQHELRTLQLTWQVRSLERQQVVELRALGPEELRAVQQQHVLQAQMHGWSRWRVELQAVAEEQRRGCQELVVHSVEDSPW